MTRFRAIAILLLLWNLAGLAAFFTQFTAVPEDMGDPSTAKAFASMPAWAWIAYAAAVSLGTVGSIALLLRRKAAWVLFGLSLIAVIVQFSWTIFGFRILDYKGPGSLVFPAVIVLVALFATIYARSKVADRTLR